MKLTQAQFGWLAGVLDGEGTICLFKEKTDRRAGFYARCVVIAIANTNPVLILRVVNLLRSVGIKCSIGTIVGEQKKVKGWSRAWNVKVSGVEAMKLYLNMIHPFLVGKREQAELAMQFLQRRSAGHAAWGITEEEELLIACCKHLNSTGSSESVETIREMSEAIAFGKDIVRSVRRRAEADGNDQPEGKFLS
jgi:hypothetical protein